MTACCSSTTFSVRRGIIPVLVCSILGAAAFVQGDPAAGAAAPSALDPAVLFPAGTVMMVSIDGGPCGQFGKELAISKIFHEPEVQEFVKSTFEFVEEMADKNVKDFSEALGLKPADLEQLAKSRIALAFTRFEMPKEGGMSEEPQLDLMLAADLRGGQKAVEPLLKMLEMQCGAVGMETAETTVGGIPAKKLAVPPGGPFEAVTYFLHDGWLIAGTSTAQLEAAVTRAKSGNHDGSLASDGFFAASMKEVMRPKTVFSFFLDYAFVMNAVASANPDLKTMMAGAGLEALKTAAFGMDLDGASIRERIFVSMAPNSPLSRLQSPMDVTGVLGRVPKRAFAAYAGSLNLKEYYDYTRKMLAQTPMVGEEMDEAMTEIDKFLGPSWREDLLPNLGPEFATFAALPQFGVVPDIGVLIKIGDRAKIEAAIAKMLDRPKAKAAHRTVKFGDVTINYLDLGVMKIDRDFNLRPAYVFVDDYMLLTVSPHSAKSILASMTQKDGGLLAREDFSRTYGRLKAESPNAGNLGIGYLDAQWLAGFMLDNTIPIVQSAVSPDDLDNAEPLKIDLGKIPSTQAITKHLSAIVLQAQTKEGGNYTEFVSPTGLVGTFVGIGVVAGVAAARGFGHSMEEPPAMPESRPSDEDR